MAEYENDIIHPGEVELYVKCLERTNIEDIGSLSWFESHKRFQTLGQQAALEAKNLRDENVKEQLITYEKVPVLVHEAICIQIWKQKILDQILKDDRELDNSFTAYMILYHELTAICLLQNVLHHPEATTALEDTVLDLIDYCASNVVRILAQGAGMKTADSCTSETTSNNDLFNEQSANLQHHVSLTCIGILMYLAENLNDVALCSVDRMYNFHDAPLLIANLIQLQPWKRFQQDKVQVYEDGSWKHATDIEGICKSEAQCWIALRYLLLNQQAMSYYEITENRKQHLLKVLKHLHEHVIDQISVLVELKSWLLQLTVCSAQAAPSRPMLVETIPEITADILRQGFKKWGKILQKNKALLYGEDKALVLDIAKRLEETYNLENLEKLEPESAKCAGCGDPASKKCSKCKLEWYCGRECQVKSWPKHKKACLLITPDGDTCN